MMSTYKILVVDDEASILLALKNLLEVKGFHVKTATNGKQGLETAVKFVPDLILLDIMMPKMNGLKFAEKIRNNEILGDTKIIFITAKGEKNDKMTGYLKGGDDYIIKPFSTEQLLSRIRFLLG